MYTFKHQAQNSCLKIIKGRRLLVSLTIQAIYQEKSLGYLLVFGGKSSISKQHLSQSTNFETRKEKLTI
jgi:hypothetical protein